MPVNDGAGARTEKAIATPGVSTGSGSARPTETGGIPIPRAVSAPTFYAVTFALGVLIGMGIALYFRP